MWPPLKYSTTCTYYHTDRPRLVPSWKTSIHYCQLILQIVTTIWFQLKIRTGTEFNWLNYCRISEHLTFSRIKKTHCVTNSPQLLRYSLFVCFFDSWSHLLCQKEFLKCRCYFSTFLVMILQTVTKSFKDSLRTFIKISDWWSRWFQFLFYTWWSPYLYWSTIAGQVFISLQ